MSDVLQPWLDRWNLVPDGEPFTTPHTGSWLMPVRRQGVAAMLKVATSEYELRGGELMTWYDGDGAAPVLEHAGGALVLERAMGARSLASIARSGEDETANRIICSAVARLHTPRPATRPQGLPTLESRFRAQEARARSQGGVFDKAWAVVTELLSAPREVIVLHGDIHHGNILDFGDRGWLAIDPQGVVGERAYDYANLFKNPDPAVATAPGRLARQVAVVADAAELDPKRLLQWALAHAALSACWSLEDGMDATFATRIAELAAAQLGV